MRKGCSTWNVCCLNVQGPSNAKLALRLVLNWSADKHSDGSESDDELRMVDQFGPIHVGMRYAAGTIMQICPYIDKVSVPNGEAQHLKLA